MEIGEKIDTKVKVRRMKIEDVDAVSDIMQYWYRNPITKKTLPIYTRFLEDIMKSIRGENRNIYLVVESEGNKIIGILGLIPVSKELSDYAIEDITIEFETVLIHPEYRSRGIGTLLVSKAEKLAQGMGYRYILLKSGFIFRKTAWYFWDSLSGYERVGEIPNLYGKGKPGKAIIWRRRLD